MNKVHAMEGYVLCGNGEHVWVSDAVAQRTNGLCATCAVAASPNTRRTIELIGRGRRTMIPTSPRKRTKRRERNPDLRRREKLNAKARDKARKRLSFMFSDIYDIVLAEERANLGLEPWPLEVAVRSGPDPDGTITEGFAALMAELETAGVDTT